MRRKPLVDDRGRLGDHAGDSHGVGQNAYWLAYMRRSWRDGQRLQLAGEGGRFERQKRQIVMSCQYGRSQIYRDGRSGKVGNEFLEHGRCSLAEGGFDIAVAIPGLGDMAIGRDQTGRDYKAGSGNAGAETVSAAGNVVDAINVSHGIARIVDRNRRERLLALEVSHLARELMHLLIEAGRFRRSVVVGHDSGADEGQDAEKSLDEALPGLDQLGFPAIGVEHGVRSGREGDSQVVTTILTYSARVL